MKVYMETMMPTNVSSAISKLQFSKALKTINSLFTKAFATIVINVISKQPPEATLMFISEPNMKERDLNVINAITQ